MHRPSALILLGLPLLLAGCESPGTFPSLAKRPAERVTGTADPAEPESPPGAPLPAPSGLQASVDRLIGQARQAHGDFEGRRAGAERAISAARGAARASEGWVSGQVALAALEASRNEALTAQSELDQLYADERIAHPEAITLSAQLLGKALEQVAAMVEEENAVLARLAGILGS